MTDDLLHETLVLWPAYQVLHAHLLTTDPRTSDPHDLVGPLAAYGHDRAACLLYAHLHGERLRDSMALVKRLDAWMHEGRRPRYGAEVGLSAKDFGVEL